MAEEAAAALRPGYRGKCLYKTGKCTNERALKTSGQPHNLCEEHRNRQNQHQRKLDAKNRFNRKEKRAKTDHMGLSAADSARLRYAPYQKARVSPTGGGAPGISEDGSVPPMLAASSVLPTTMPAHAMPYPTMTMTTAPQLLPGAPNVVPEMLSSGWVVLPNGPQPPQMPYSAPIQDFDGIVVPIPSALEGQERAEFRARVYQKVMDFIAEEYGRRSVVPGVDDKPLETPHVDEPVVASAPDGDTSERRPIETPSKDDAELAAAKPDSVTDSPNDSNEDLQPEHVPLKKTRGRARKAVL